MEELILTRPASEYAGQIAEYRQEFLDAGDSMGGTGPLRRTEDTEEYIKVCIDYEDPKMFRLIWFPLRNSCASVRLITSWSG